MKLVFLGASYAFITEPDCFQSNMLIESNSHRRMLVDCGSDVRRSLRAVGLSFSDIDAVYISHLHADHIGGLEWLGFSKKFNGQKKPLLYISDDQKETLWKHALSAGMSSLEYEKANLDSFFEVISIPNQTFSWENIQFELVRVPHTCSHHEFLPSYGLFVIHGKENIFISTDTRFSQDVLMSVYEKASLIFHDCETSEKLSAQHAHFNELKTLPSSIKKKMWLYDYNDPPLPDAIKAGFLGFVKAGQIFTWK